MDKLTLDDHAKVLILTGAGASAESGIATFRDANGLWENHRVEDVAAPEAFVRNPQLVWRFYSQRRTGVLQAQPNRGHWALAALEKRLGERMLLATQNVDGLHARAGQERLLEIHGNVLQTRCSICQRVPFVDHSLYDEHLPACGQCRARGVDAILRPHIVWFGELLDPQHLRDIENFMMDAAENLIFIAIGTSGQVWPAAGLVNLAKRVGGETWLINAEEAANTRAFDHFIAGSSAKVLPDFLGVEDAIESLLHR